MREAFQETILVDNMYATFGNLNPLPAGETHAILVVVPSSVNYTTLIFGVTYTDEAGLTSDLSNLVAVTFKKAILKDRDSQIGTMTSDPENNSHLVVFITVSCLVGVIIVTVISLSVLSKLKRKGHKKDLPRMESQCCDKKEKRGM